MSLFQITIDEQDAAGIVRARLEKYYPDHFFEMRNGISWICATDNAADLSERVLLDNKEDKSPNSKKVPGVVVQVQRYMGYYTPDLWEQMEIWFGNGKGADE